MVFCLYNVFKSNFCLPQCFFVAFIFFDFLLLPSKLSGIIMPSWEFVSTLQDHCLPQTTLTEPNFILEIFSTLSNLKVKFQGFALVYRVGTFPHEKGKGNMKMKMDNMERYSVFLFFYFSYSYRWCKMFWRQKHGALKLVLLFKPIPSKRHL